MKIEAIPIKEPVSSDNIVAMAHALMATVFENDVDFVKIQYRIDGEVYSYSLGKK